MEYQLLKLPKQETAHYFHNGLLLCGRSTMNLYTKVFKPKQDTLICRNCTATLARMKKCCRCHQDLPEDYIYDCPLHGLNCKSPICAECVRTGR